MSAGAHLLARYRWWYVRLQADGAPAYLVDQCGKALREHAAALIGRHCSPGLWG